MIYLLLINKKEIQTMNTSNLNCQRLIACRKALGITKQEAAKRMQMSQPAYLRYESGERTPSIHIIYFMAMVLGTSADYLTNKTNDPTPNTYWIDATGEPELFSLIEAYQKSDVENRKRLLSYLSKLAESKSE